MSENSNSETRSYLALSSIIFFGLALRLYDFDGSILTHHWLRQVDSAAIARNFAEEGLNIFYPRVDWRGASKGYVESELQIYTYLTALLQRLLQWDIVQIGRGLNLLFYTLTAWILFDLGRQMFDETRGLLAVFFYSFNPLSAYFARSFQPDTLMVLATLCAINFFWRWSDDGKISNLALSAVAASAAILIKPLNIILGAPLLYLSFRRYSWQAFVTPQLWAYAAVALVPSVIWYHHAYQLWVEHGNTLFRAYGDWTQTAVWSNAFYFKLISLTMPSCASEMAWRGMFHIAAVGGIVPFAIGTAAAIQDRNWTLITWAAAFGATMLIFAYQHCGHDYYQLPLVIIASLLMADGVARLWRGTFPTRVLAVVLAVSFIVVELWLRSLWGRGNINHSQIWPFLWAAGIALMLGFALLERQSALRIVVAASLLLTAATSLFAMTVFTTPEYWSAARQEFGSKLESLTSSDARVVIAQNYTRPGWFQHRTPQGELLGYMPTDFFFARRKGWSVSREHATPAFVEELRRRGATHFAAWCCQRGSQDVNAEFPELAKHLACNHAPLSVDKQYLIYKLDEPRSHSEQGLCLPN